MSPKHGLYTERTTRANCARHGHNLTLRKDACDNLVRFPRYRTYLLENRKTSLQVRCYCDQEEADREDRSFALSICLVYGYIALDDPSACERVLCITKRLYKLKSYINYELSMTSRGCPIDSIGWASLAALHPDYTKSMGISRPLAPKCLRAIVCRDLARASRYKLDDIVLRPSRMTHVLLMLSLLPVLFGGYTGA